MNKETDPDASVDRLLTGMLRARVDAASDTACLDAETLAAWADGALDARERAIAEAHAADCGRCQAMLAAMVRTQPPAAAAPSTPWLARSLWWLAPMTAAAAALVIWVAVPNRAPVQQSQDVPEPLDQVTPGRVAAPATALGAAPLANARMKAGAGVPPNDQPAVPSADLRERRDAAAAPLEKKAPDAPAIANARSEALTLGGAAPVSSAAPSAAPAQAGADANLQRETPLTSARASAFANTPEVVVVSSNPATRFRLLRGGGVQRSADAGATWRVEVTGAAETLTAGSSPSPSVCWLVGPSGTIVLSTDGRSWRRLAFPEAVDLRSVDATDSDSATVTTSDGRAFITDDGGRTWSRGPGF